MPYLFSTNVRYENERYILWGLDDICYKFPFLQNKVISGRFVSAYIDGKTMSIRKTFRCKIVKEQNNVVGIIEEPNPLKIKGLPPCEVLVTFDKYEEGEGEKTEIPIMEGRLLKGTVSSYFDDEVKRILKDEEIKIILESIVFHPFLSKLALDLKNAYFLFEQENFSSTKTACRRILEKMRNVVSKWKAIDGSESLCEKFRQILNGLYSFSSIGGPHEGSATQEETELILKSTHHALIYVNSILKNQRFTQAESK